MNTSVGAEMERLGSMTLAALRARYREVYGEEATSAHRQHLVRRIAWRVQWLGEITRGTQEPADLAPRTQIGPRSRPVAPRGAAGRQLVVWWQVSEPESRPGVRIFDDRHHDRLASRTYSPSSLSATTECRQKDVTLGRAGPERPRPASAAMATETNPQ